MLARILIPLALAFLVGCQTSEKPSAEPAEEAATALVEFPREAQVFAKLETARVERKPFADPREALGQVASRPEDVSLAHASVSGHVVKLHAKVGDRVIAGAALATLDSAALGSAQASYLKARGQADLARRERNRLRGLLKAELASQREVEAAEQLDAAAQVSLTQADHELKLLGCSDAEIKNLSRIAPQVVLRAPQPGTLVEQHAAVGQFVTPEAAEPLFKLIDLRTARVEVELPERDFLAIQVGMPAKVTLAALPGQEFEGRVSRLSPTVDPQTRTGQALIDLPNPKGTLRPGMSVKATLMIVRPNVRVVPSAAVQREGERAFLYVPRGEDRFEEVTVTLGKVTPEAVELVEGPEPGTPVVTRGSFDLRSQARRAQFGGD